MPNHQELLASGLHECAADCPPSTGPHTQAGRDYLVELHPKGRPADNFTDYLNGTERRSYDHDVDSILAIEREAASLAAPPERCPTCQGSGEVDTRNGPDCCPDCAGSGTPAGPRTEAGRKRNQLKPQGRGVFACRVCGQPIPPTYEWVMIGLSMRPIWEAGYCSRYHLEKGRKAGWVDDLAQWNREVSRGG